MCLCFWDSLPLQPFRSLSLVLPPLQSPHCCPAALNLCHHVAQSTGQSSLYRVTNDILPTHVQWASQPGPGENPGHRNLQFIHRQSQNSSTSFILGVEERSVSYLDVKKDYILFLQTCKSLGIVSIDGEQSQTAYCGFFWDRERPMTKVNIPACEYS